MTRFPTVFLLAASLPGCSAAEAITESPEGAVPITIAAVSPLPVARPIHGAGRLRARDEAVLSFPFGGVVADVAAVRGQRVRRGEVLARLDAVPARAQLAAAESALAKAERDADRARVLEGTALSTAQQQDAATGLDVARANLDAARFQTRRSLLVAPTDGVVVDVFAEDGQTAGAGQPILTFAGDGGLEVELVLPAELALLADPGTPAVATVRAARATVPGRVVERAGGAGPLGGFTVVVTLDPTDAPLAPGLVAAVDLSARPDVRLTVPVESLAEADGAEAAVYAVQDGVARRVPVVVDFLAGPLAVLAEGPPAGTPVVVDGVPFVADGAAVEVR
jgi:RND family efflux transporter MFP subunit